MTKKRDYTGLRSGKLVVLKQVGSAKNGKQILLCRCDCGNTHTTRADSLVSGDTQSCGCMNHRDYTGLRSGKLVVLHQVGKTNGGEQLLLCQCDCGNTHTADGSSLAKGHTNSCGCLVSYKNWEIEKWLRAEGYDYQTEYRIPECHNIKPLPFDFAVFKGDDIKLVEYNGEQHYKPTKLFGIGNLAYIQNHDAIKAAFCDNNEIPLLVLNKTFPDIFNTLEWFLL